MDIEFKDDSILVKVEYPPFLINQYFRHGALGIGGRFERDTWIFSRDLEQRVRSLCLNTYGEYGEERSQCDVLLHFHDTQLRLQHEVELQGKLVTSVQMISLFGSAQVWSFGRGSLAKYAQNLGDFFTPFRSQQLRCAPDTKIKISGVSRALMNQHLDYYFQQYEVDVEIINSP